MQKVRAAVCRDYNTPMKIEDIQLRDPQMGEVAVDIDAVAICHSDISFWQGGFGGALPAVYGHEARPCPRVPSRRRSSWIKASFA